jgi:7,8-dihydropterin-6-yl-methyl-4-(beta-D-ribofuranosyl)aminobenzene 5'-phosphate synthase
MKVGVDHGFGCYAEKLPQDERTKSIIPGQFRHEIPTAFNLRGRGLIILTSCSHRGVINTIKQAQAVSGVKKVHAVIGGFHLAPYKEDYVRKTIMALEDIDADFVIPLHCTGERFMKWPRPRCRANCCGPTREHVSSSAVDNGRVRSETGRNLPALH